MGEAEGLGVGVDAGAGAGSDPPPPLDGALGVAVVVEEALPGPLALTAVTRNSYEVPFVNPVTVAVLAVDVPSAKVDQLPEPVRYSMM